LWKYKDFVKMDESQKKATKKGAVRADSYTGEPNAEDISRRKR
jgi:hypothetical protein